MDYDRRVLSGQRRRLRGVRLISVLAGVAFLLGLPLFGYFAGAVDTFPGEVSVSNWVQSRRTPWLDFVMKAISLPGILAIAGPLVLVTSTALYIKGWRAEGVLISAAAVAGRLVTFGLKEAIGRPRPSEGLVQVLQDADGYSFPSGHVMHYVVFLGTLAVILTMRVKTGLALRFTQVALVVAVIAIAYSRIYLGTHWAGDVIGGYVFGAAVVIGAVAVWRRWTDGRTRSTGR